MPSRRTVLGAALAAALPRLARAEGYPDRTIRLIVPYPPGGSTDITTRIIGERMGTELGRRFLVDNRPGAGGNLGFAGRSFGAREVAAAEEDAAVQAD